jgi:hypothetical protein
MRAVFLFGGFTFFQAQFMLSRGRVLRPLPNRQRNKRLTEISEKKLTTRTATMLFLDANGIPFDVPDPVADVFYFTNSGLRTWILPQGSAMTKVPGETGRYTVSFLAPPAVRTIYATMYGTDPITGSRMSNEQQILKWR